MTETAEAPSEERAQPVPLSVARLLVLAGLTGLLAICTAVIWGGALREPTNYLEAPGATEELGVVILGAASAVIVGVLACQTTSSQLAVAVAGVGVVLIALGFGIGLDGTVSSECTVIEGPKGGNVGNDYYVRTRETAPIVAAVGAALLTLGLAAVLLLDSVTSVPSRLVVAAFLIAAALALGVMPDREIAGDGIWHVPPQCGGDIQIGTS